MHVGDINLIMEDVGSLRRFKRRDSDIYISVTPEGELKALVSFTITTFHNHIKYIKIMWVPAQ